MTGGRVVSASRPHRLLACLLACVLATMLAFTLSGCDKGDTRTAGRVFDHEVTEQDVIDYIDAYRDGSSTTDDADWAAWLGKKNTTAEALRKETVNYLCQNWLVDRAAGERGISVSDDEVQKKLDEQKAQYPSQIAFTRALINSGYTEDAYRLTVKSDLLKGKIKETFADPATVSDDEVEEFANSEMNGRRVFKTSAVYLKADKGSNRRFAAKAKAQDALNALRAGTPFEEVFQKYSDTSYSQDGNMGYDLYSAPNEPYRKAVNSMRKKGDVSEVVEADDGYYVIVCTDVFSDRLDGDIRLKKIPAELVEDFRGQLAKEKANEAYDDFMTKNVSEAQIAVEPMPEGLPYDVQPTGGAASSSASAAQGSSSSAESEEEVEDFSKARTGEDANKKAQPNANPGE